MFLNLENSRERNYGTTFVNDEEAQIVEEIVKIFIDKKYDMKRFGFVSPYSGQISLLKNKLSKYGMDQQVKTIDSW